MPEGPNQSAAGLWKRYGRRVFALLVAAVSLYFVLPSLVAVFSSFRTLSGVRWVWVVPMLVCEGLSYVAIWELDRIALRVRSWSVVASAHLSGNAVGRVLPGGGATA